MQLGRIAWSYGYLRQVKRRAHRASPELRRSFDAWMMSCGVHRTTVLLVSKEIGSPMAVGFRQPAVILPAALLEHFHEPELDHVLLHELAHIARQDDWTNLGARLASSLLALHPVAAWVLRQIEREREMACDDWVVSMTGEARPYAASLARLFEVCFTRRRMMLASGMAQRSSHLGERIQTLLHRRGEYPSKASISRVVLSSAVLLALAIAGTQAPQWLVLAQDAPVASMQEQTPPPAPAAQPAPTAPRAPEAPQAPASTPSPEAAPEAPQAPVPALASTPPLSGRADTLAIEQELDRLQAVRAGLAKTYGPRHPELERIRAQIATLENVINSSPAPAPQPGRASTPPARGSFLAALVAAGYGNLSVDEIINLKSAGVTTQFLEGINQAGWGKLSAQELIDLSQHGVNPEYIRKMKAAGIRDLTLKDIMELAMFGVRPETMQEIHGLGFGPYTAKEAIQFAQYGLRIDLFRALKDSGLGNATPNEIVEAYTVGLNARDLREARQYGSNLTLKQIVKLKMAGVF
jgi:hypothetical protein